MLQWQSGEHDTTLCRCGWGLQRAGFKQCARTCLAPSGRVLRVLGTEPLYLISLAGKVISQAGNQDLQVRAHQAVALSNARWSPIRLALNCASLGLVGAALFMSSHNEVCMVKLALDTGADKWARGLHCELVSLGYQHQATYAMHPIEMATLRSLLAARRAPAWAGLAVSPRTCPSEGARLCTYACSFQRLPGITTKLLQQPLTASVMRKFLQFRMGSHGLPGLTGGWAGIPRDARVCPLCQSHYPDERHT